MWSRPSTTIVSTTQAKSEGRLRQGVEGHAEDRVLHRIGRDPILTAS
jgi:hypothetical protein